MDTEFLLKASRKIHALSINGLATGPNVPCYLSDRTGTCSPTRKGKKLLAPQKDI